MRNPLGSEATRGWLYRLALLGAVIFIGYTRPDSMREILPVLLAILGNGLASVNTSVKGRTEL